MIAARTVILSIQRLEHAPPPHLSMKIDIANHSFRQVLRQKQDIPSADIERIAVGDDSIAADCVSYWGDSVEPSDIDLFSNLDRVIDFDAEISNGALNFRMSERLGFILRISFLIENQRRAARRSVLAAAERSSSR